MAERISTWLGDAISEEILSLTTWLHKRGIKQEPESQQTQEETETFELAGKIFKAKNVTGQSRWVFVTLWPHPRKPQCSLADSVTSIVAKFGPQALNTLNIPSRKPGALVNIIDFEINVNVALEGDRQIQLIINRCEIASSGHAIVPTRLQPIQDRTRVRNMLRRLRKVQQVGHQDSGSDSDLEEIEPEDFTASIRLPLSTLNSKTIPKPSQSGRPASSASASEGPMRHDQATKLLGALNQKSGASRPADFDATRLFRHFGVAQPVPTTTQSQSVGFMTQCPQPVMSSQASDVLEQGPAQPSEQIAQQNLDSVEGAEEEEEEQDPLEENPVPTQLPEPIEHRTTALTEDEEKAKHKSDGLMDLASEGEDLANETTQDISPAQPLATQGLRSADGQRMPHPLYWNSAQIGVPHNQMRTLGNASVWVGGDSPISLAVVPQEILDEQVAASAVEDADVDSSYESSSDAEQELPTALPQSVIDDGTTTPEPDSSAPLPWSQSPPRHFVPPADLLPPNSSGEPLVMPPSTILDDRRNQDKLQDEDQDKHRNDEQNENQDKDGAEVEGVDQYLDRDMDQDMNDLGADQHPDVEKDENNDNVQAELSDESIESEDEEDWLNKDGSFKASQPSPSQQNPSQQNPSQQNPSQQNPSQQNPSQSNTSQPNISTARKSPQMNPAEVEPLPPNLATSSKDAARLSPLNSSRLYGSTNPEPSPFSGTQTTRHGMFKTSPLVISSSAAANLDAPKPSGPSPRIEVAETTHQSSAAAAAANNSQKRNLSPVSKAKDKEHKKRRTSRFEWSQSSDEAEEDPHVVSGKRKHEFFKDAPRAPKVQQPLQPSELSQPSQTSQPLEDPHIAYARRRQEHLRAARQLQRPPLTIGVIDLTKSTAITGNDCSDEEMDDGPAIETVTRSSDLEVLDGQITTLHASEEITEASAPILRSTDLELRDGQITAPSIATRKDVPALEPEGLQVTVSNNQSPAIRPLLMTATSASAGVLPISTGASLLDKAVGLSNIPLLEDQTQSRLGELFERFKADYPKYRGKVKVFHRLCQRLLKPNTHDNHIPLQDWDIYILKYDQFYAPYVQRCVEEVETPLTYERFLEQQMAGNVEAPKHPFLTPKVVREALDSVDSPALSATVSPTTSLQTPTIRPRDTPLLATTRSRSDLTEANPRTRTVTKPGEPPAVLSTPQRSPAPVPRRVTPASASSSTNLPPSRPSPNPIHLSRVQPAPFPTTIPAAAQSPSSHPQRAQPASLPTIKPTITPSPFSHPLPAKPAPVSAAESSTARSPAGRFGAPTYPRHIQPPVSTTTPTADRSPFTIPQRVTPAQPSSFARQSLDQTKPVPSTSSTKTRSPFSKAQPHSVHANDLLKNANQPPSVSKPAPIHPDRAAIIHATTPEGFRQQKLAQKIAKRKQIETQITKDATEELYSSAKTVPTLPPSNASSAGPTGSSSIFDRFSAERLKEMIEFDEPKRSFDWLTGVCESDPSSYLTQVEICRGYTKAFDSGKGLLDNKQFLNVVTFFFKGSFLTNLDINLNEKVGVVQGLRVKKTPPENASSSSGHGSATPPVIASGSAKRSKVRLSSGNRRSSAVPVRAREDPSGNVTEAVRPSQPSTRAHEASPSTQRGKGRKVLPRDAPQELNKSDGPWNRNSASSRGGHFRNSVQTAPKGAPSGPRAMRDSETRSNHSGPVQQGPATPAPPSGEPRQGDQRVVNPLSSQHQQQKQQPQRPHNANANSEKSDEDANNTDIQLAKGCERVEEPQEQTSQRIAERVAESKTLRSSWHISRFDEFYTTYSMLGKSRGNAWANNDQRDGVNGGMEQDTMSTVDVLGWGPY